VAIDLESMLEKGPGGPVRSETADDGVGVPSTLILPATVRSDMAQRTVGIVRDEGVMGGEPRIDGRRIAVRQIAEWVEDGDLSAKTVADRYDLDIADVYRALTYYHEHPAEMAEVQRRRREQERRARERGAKTLSELREEASKNE
jgi:uncharacterized protein (DUF433 family)